MSASDSSVVCQMCSATNPAQARYCLNCGTRLVPAGADTPAEAAAFEDALAAVVSDTPTPPPPAPAPPLPTWSPTPAPDMSAPVNDAHTPLDGTPAESSGAPGTWGAPSASPTVSPQGTWASSSSTTSGDAGSWGSTGQAAGQGWPTVDGARKPRRWPWVILAVVGALVFCCCGLAGIGLVADQAGAVGMTVPYA